MNGYMFKRLDIWNINVQNHTSKIKTDTIHNLKYHWF